MSFPPDHELNSAERQAMLALARAAIVSRLTKQKPSSSTEPASFALRRGLFVTLHVDGKLRGCIGVVEPRDTLRESVIHCAESAAFHDPRFSALRSDELGGLEIEISLLSELFPIAPAEIEIGRHGLLITTENHRGLLLPQVATEHRLTREEFLAETCYKAGLPRDAWRGEEIEIYGFTCEIFSEGREAASA